MVIHCTRKLIEELGVFPEEVAENPLFSWHANLILVNRKKTLVLENDLTRYPIVLVGLKASDLINIKDVILASIRETLLFDGISKEVVDKFLKLSGPITFTRAQDKKKISCVNQTCQNIYYEDELLNFEVINQSAISRKLAGLLVKDKNGEYQRINEYLYKELESVTKLRVFSGKALQIKATLQVGSHISWRRLTIPHNITFTSLHNAMQISFDWHDTHMHEFIILKQEKPIVSIIDNMVTFTYMDDYPRLSEKNLKVSKYLPKYKKLFYRYDIGDLWDHMIEVEDILFDYDKYYPTCIGGEGDAPPEDVGGVSGYDRFLKITSNPDHEAHSEMMNWAHMQRYRPFDINIVNIRLKDI
jgi:hypothetical protein